MPYRWYKEFAYSETSGFPGNGIIRLTQEQERIRDLEKKLADVELEHKIFKKTIAFFSRTEK